MYGIVNQAIQGLVLDNYGNEKWKSIKKRSGVIQDYFISDESYDDEITFDLVSSASEVLELDSKDVLKAFGHYWIAKTGNEKYGELMKTGGSDFLEFMENLPNFHGRIMLIYPKLSPPEFIVEKKSDSEIELHYFSSRKGLTYFVFGLIEGIAEMFDTKVEIILKDSSDSGVWHDTFSVRILKK